MIIPEPGRARSRKARCVGGSSRATPSATPHGLTEGEFPKEESMGTLLWIAAVILDIFAITDVMNSSRDTATKIVLLVLILLLPFVGAGLYLFAFRDKGYS
jgi:hypothetical protein